VGTKEIELGIDVDKDDLVELLVADASLARAFYAGIPTARLLARLRLASDEADLDAPPTSRPTSSSWDRLITKLVAGAGETALDSLRRAIARHARAASDEGPLDADEPTIAALVLAVASAADADTSLAEALAGGEVAPELVRACAAYDPRLLSPDRRGPLFEACLRLAKLSSVGPWPEGRVREAAHRLRSSDDGVDMLRKSSAALLPLDLEPEVLRSARRMVLLERGELDAFVARDPRELATAVARAERGDRDGTRIYLDKLVADLTRLLSHRGALVFATVNPHLPIEDLAPARAPSVRPVSWMPTSWAAPDAASILAKALEGGTTTLPRVRGVIARGGDPALDAIGAEMLRVASHPFASAAFAEVLARTGRPRDVTRLVTYFAVAPDPRDAAAALGQCSAPELPGMLTDWLTAMLPTDGALAPPGEDPETSSGARLSACVLALRPYPHLYAAVRPLLARVTDPPTPASG
jgi:hypothetical protein